MRRGRNSNVSYLGTNIPYNPFIFLCIKSCLNKLIVWSKPKSLLCPKGSLVFDYLLLGKNQWLCKINDGNYSRHNFQPSNFELFWNLTLTLAALFNFKDIPFRVLLYVVYKFSCGNFDITYSWETTRRLLVRLSKNDRKYNIISSHCSEVVVLVYVCSSSYFNVSV